MHGQNHIKNGLPKLPCLLKDDFCLALHIGFHFNIVCTSVIVCDRFVLLDNGEYIVCLPSSLRYTKRIVGRNKHAFQSTGNTHHDKDGTKCIVSLLVLL